jgi:uncharacterized surface protein with fasciclin (FAS1) repeats
MRALLLYSIFASSLSPFNCGSYFGQRTIAGKISARWELSTLSLAMQISGLDHFFQCSDFCVRYTIFCPNNASFAEFPHLEWFADERYTEHLKQLVRYHVLPGRMFYADFVDGRNYQTLQGEMLLASKGSVLKLNGDTTVPGYLNIVRNGIMQGVSKVLLPSFARESVLDVVRRSASHFFQALELTGMDAYLENHGPMTVLAPSNASFAVIMKSMMLNDTAMLTELVKQYIIPDVVLLEGDLKMAGVEYVTLFGSNLALCGDSSIIAPNTLGSNGIVHIFSCPTVIMLNLWDLLSRLPELESFRNSMITAGLNATLQTAGPISLFAPSNEAMGSFQVRPGNEDDIQDLLYHIVEAQGRGGDLFSNFFTTASRDNVLIDVKSDGTMLLNGNIEASPFGQETSNGVLHIISQRLGRPVDLVATAESQGLTSFVRALQLTNLEAAFQDDGPFTMFGWTDSAWDKLGSGVTNSLLNDLDRLRRVVLFHVLPQFILLDGLHDGNYTTLLQRDVTVHVDTVDPSTNSVDVHVNDAQVSKFDMLAFNGCLHLISQVLLTA